MPELDAAIFDFGGVLTTSIRASFTEFERQLNLDDGTLIDAFRHEAESGEPDFFLLEKGLITEADFYQRMLQNLRDYTGKDIQFPGDPVKVRQMLFGSIRRNDDMIAAAVRIGAHYKTAILTNNVKEWTDWREWVEAHIFDLIVDSSHEGMRKPDPEIYLLTCERLGVDPTRAAFVDDIPTNVEGAQGIGLHAIQFTTTEEVLEQLRPLFPRAFSEDAARA
jgi:putative hydrolase of the HAD superfamily